MEIVVYNFFNEYYRKCLEPLGISELQINLFTNHLHQEYLPRFSPIDKKSFLLYGFDHILSPQNY